MSKRGGSVRRVAHPEKSAGNAMPVPILLPSMKKTEPQQKRPGSAEAIANANGSETAPIVSAWKKTPVVSPVSKKQSWTADALVAATQTGSSSWAALDAEDEMDYSVPAFEDSVLSPVVTPAAAVVVVS